MKKAIVIGCPGAGKSTFARRLHEKTKLPLFYLDTIYHKPDKTHISREEFDKRLSEIFSLDEWIIDGQYARTLERRIIECDTVFFLDFPVSVCLEGVKSRIGKERPEMPWQETELDEEFKQWILDFPQRDYGKTCELLEKYNHKNIYVFKTREQADGFLEKFL